MASAKQAEAIVAEQLDTAIEHSIYNITLAPDHVADSKGHEWVPIYCQRGMDLTGSNSDNADYQFTIPQGLYSLDDTYFDVTVKVAQSAAGAVGDTLTAYATGTATTYIAFQNSIHSLFQRESLKINSEDIELIDNPGLLDTVEWMQKTEDELTTQGRLAGVYKDTGALDARTSTNTGYAARSGLITNRTELPLHFIMKPIFNAMTQRHVATFAKNWLITLFRNNDAAMLEADATATTAEAPVVTIIGLCMWLHKVAPDTPYEAMIMSSIANHVPQVLSFKERKVNDTYTVTATTTNFEAYNAFDRVPKAVMIGFRPDSIVNKRVFKPDNIQKIYFRMGEKQYPVREYRPSSMTSNRYAMNCMREYYDYLRGTGALADGCSSIISLDDWLTRFCIFYIDTSDSPTGLPEFVKGAVNTSVVVEFSGTGPTGAGKMTVIYFFDRQYTISGSEPIVAKAY